MFKRAIFIFSLLFGGILFAAPSDAWIHGRVSAICPYATDNGCAAANQNGSFQNVSLLTSAQQSGQNSLLPGHPMTFNIPGVDYPIGPDRTLTPRDPRTISDGICAWNGTIVGCVAGSTTAEVLNNYDFCGTKIGKANVQLYLGGPTAAGSSLTVTNSYFCVTPTVEPFAWGGGGGQNWSIVYKNNQCDATTVVSATYGGFCLGDDVDAVGTSIDIEYNAFTNQNLPRIVGGPNYATFTMKYNFMEMNNLNSSIHGEIMLRNCSGARANCAPFDNYEGNFIIWDPPFTSGLNNATVFPGDGASDGVALTSFTLKNNVIVTNKNGSNQTAIDQSLFNARLSTLGVLTMTGNWVDSTGSNDCSINGVKSGGNSVTASSSGNTLTVTGLSGSFGNSPIEPGWLIAHAGFTTTPITAYGTGTGQTGTYTFGGAAQNVGSDSNWTLVPGFSGTPTLTGNFGLADPGHTGIPVAMGLNGLQVTATSCPPHY